MHGRWYKIRTEISRVSEGVYFFMFILLTLYSILTMVCLDVTWENIGEAVPAVHFLIMKFVIEPQQVLLVLVVIRYAFSENYNWKELLAAVVIYMCASHAVKVNHFADILTITLFMLGARGISFKKIIKVYVMVAATVVFCVVAASQIGWIENLVYRPPGRSLRMAFGFTYPTRFAAHIYYLVLWYWYLRDEKLAYRETLIPVFAGIFLWIFCEARLSSISLVLLALTMAYSIFQQKKVLKLQAEYRMHPYVAQLLAISAVCLAFLILLLTFIYSPDRPILEWLNDVISNRLYLGKKAMDIFGFQIWGTWIRLAGNGGYLTGNSRYFYIDSVFLQFGIQYGLVMMTILLALFNWIGTKAKKQKKWVLLWILLFAGIHGMFEPHMISISYSPLIFAAFADLQKETVGRAGVKKKRKNKA